MSLPYRPNVCMLVYNRERELWIGQRFGAETWQFPQGGVGRSSPIRAVIRELREELGLHKRHLGQITRLQATHRYDFLHTPPHWRHRWRGQEQSFWAVEFLGPDSEIDLTGHSPQEFSQWSWCPVDQVLERVEEIRRPGYLAPLQEFRQLRLGTIFERRG
jgi:putative (di)nucleoside polyphosphate hydrolase